jgi:Protein of unknown function (DUF3667)/Domain of unknown function (DUF4286)
MTNRSGPVYEATFFIDKDVADDCEQWLAEHVRDTLRLPGVADCVTFPATDDDNGHARRICLVAFDGDAALNEYLDGSGSEIESLIEALFAGQVTVSYRVLREDRHQPGTAADTPDCLNCGARLRGQYCAVCGQRARSRLISLWELISDAFGDLFEIDSRLWQTLVPLMIRPGRLTHDYLQGRRARYMPPFRMYLVLSLLFFLVAFFDPRENFGLLFEPQPEAGPAAGSAAPTDEAERKKQEILDELAGEGIVVGDTLPKEAADKGSGLNIQLDGNGEPGVQCKIDDEDMASWPAWLQRRLTPERLKHICERTQIDGGQAFIDKLLDNIPTALIVLLPLMAFVLKALYPLSKRYYVEHLLFFVHFHAFFFMLLTLQVLYARIGGLLSFPEPATVLPLVVGSFYVPVYLFVSMRRVYGQGRIITFIKYIVLFIAYILGFTATMLGALAIAALSV